MGTLFGEEPGRMLPDAGRRPGDNHNSPVQLWCHNPEVQVQGPKSKVQGRNVRRFRLWTLDFGPWTLRSNCGLSLFTSRPPALCWQSPEAVFECTQDRSSA